MKTAKIFTLLFLLIIGSTQATAQDDVDDCAKKRSLYYQYLKQSMWRDAMNFWGEAYTACTSKGETMDSKFWKNGRVGYLQLQKALKDESTKNEEKLAGLNDTIAWIYEERMKVEDDKKWTADYANFLVGQKDTHYEKIDSLYWDAIHSLKSDASYAHIRLYFTHLIANDFNNATTENQEKIRGLVIEEYVTLSEYDAAAIQKYNTEGNTRQVKAYENTQAFLDKYFLQVAKDCDALVPVMEKKFDELSEDSAKRLLEVKKYLTLLDNKACQETEIYGAFLNEQLELDPTAEAYYFKGSLETKKENNSAALEAFEKAVELEGDGENKSKYTYKLARALYGARSYKSAFNKAKSVDGEYKGDALDICASCVAALANDCGESTFNRKANYWLANDYVQRAIANGGKSSSSKFLSNAPDDGLIFDEGKEKGQTVSLTCWGETTTIR